MSIASECRLNSEALKCLPKRPEFLGLDAAHDRSLRIGHDQSRRIVHAEFVEQHARVVERQRYVYFVMRPLVLQGFLGGPKTRRDAEPSYMLIVSERRNQRPCGPALTCHDGPRRREVRLAPRRQE